MRTYTWEEYYEKFYDWTESKQIKNLLYIESLGDADEVMDVIYELKDHKTVATSLLKRAVDEKIKFSGDNIFDMFFFEFDKEISMKALKNSVENLTTEDIENLSLYVEEEILLEICKQQKIPIPEEFVEEPDYIEESDYIDDIVRIIENACVEPPKTKPQKLGFGGHLLAMAIALGKTANTNSNKRHQGRCNGDCANCPPHYGYRYGRRYYGKGHVRGCQFGGNRGDGSLL